MPGIGTGAFTAADSTLPGSRLAAKAARRNERETRMLTCDHGRELRRMERGWLETSGRSGLDFGETLRPARLRPPMSFAANRVGHGVTGETSRRKTEAKSV